CGPAVLLGEDRGPAVPPQAADAPVRFTLGLHRRHRGAGRGQTAGQPGDPETPHRVAVRDGAALAPRPRGHRLRPGAAPVRPRGLDPGRQPGPAPGGDHRISAGGFPRPGCGPGSAGDDRPQGARPRPGLPFRRRGAEPLHHPAEAGHRGDQGQRTGSVLGHRPVGPVEPDRGADLEVLPVGAGVRSGATVDHRRSGAGAARRRRPHRAGRSAGNGSIEPGRGQHEPIRSARVTIELQDLSGTFSVFDVVVSLALSFVLAVIVGWVYRYTHKNVSYSQSYVQTLVMVCMIISVIMLVVGSNIARAFALVGALSVIRFRN